MKFKILIVSFLFLCVFGQKMNANGLHIEFKAPQLKGKQIVLCNYFEGSNYRLDSCYISSSGLGVIQQSQSLPEGLYLVYASPTSHFDLLLADDQKFTITIDTVNFLNNKIQGASQSEAFIEYARFLSNQQKERTRLFESLQQFQSENKNTESIEKQLADQNAKVFDFQQSFFDKHKNEWVGNFFKGVIPVENPFPEPQNSEERQLQVQYMKEYYFDHINLQDRRFWYSSVFPQKIVSYMQQCVEFIPDSLANAASRLVQKTRGDSVCFRLTLNFLTNNSLQSNILGMENIWAKLAEDYYLKKDVTPWADSAFLADIRSEYTKVRFNRVGMNAQNILLTDTAGNSAPLYNASSKYTLLCFFEPSCAHCKELMPQIHDMLYQKYHNKGLEISCVYMLTDKTEWMNFIRENRLEDWTNLWDPSRESFFWHYYDTSTTPAIFLLDENKKIIAKKLDIESLDKMLERLTNSL